ARRHAGPLPPPGTRTRRGQRAGRRTPHRCLRAGALLPAHHRPGDPARRGRRARRGARRTARVVASPRRRGTAVRHRRGGRRGGRRVNSFVKGSLLWLLVAVVVVVSADAITDATDTVHTDTVVTILGAVAVLQLLLALGRRW